MTRLLLAFLLLVWPIGCALAQVPAGYVLEISLSGEDADRGTAVVRGGEELTPQPMMPLFDGDTVFVRDSASRIVIEVGDGQMVEIGANLPRYTVSGEIDTGDGFWSILSKVGTALGGGDAEAAPETMASRNDDSLKVPIAVRGTNYVLRDGRGVWLGWIGGEAPYSVAVDDLPAQSTDRRDMRIMPPDKPRFRVTISDARGQTHQLHFRFADALPPLPVALASRPDGMARQLAVAAWLTGEDGGAWTIAAAQGLVTAAGEGTAAGDLLARLRGGWRLE